MSQFSRRQLQDIDIKELIQHYKQYDCLWDINSPDYKNHTTKYQAWKEIAKYFNKDVEEVKRKVKYLRSAYINEKKKVESSKKSGTGSPHKPNLFYYNDLDFLENVVVWRKFNADNDSNTTEFENVQLTHDTEDDVEMISFANRIEEVDFKESDICKSEVVLEPEPELSPPPAQQNMTIGSTPLHTHTRRAASRAPKRRLSEDDSRTKNSFSTVSHNHPNNLYMSFGKTLSLQLQQLPMDIAVLTMSEIHTILTRKTLEHIRSEQNSLDSDSEESYSELIEETTNDLE